MTRFARAKGSKSSNERVPNEATPWHVMKGQLEDNVTMKNNQTPRSKSAKELLSEKDEPYYYDSTGNVNNQWAEFDTPGVEIKSSKKKIKKEIMKFEVSEESKNQKILKFENIEALETSVTKQKDVKLKVEPKSKKKKLPQSGAPENGNCDVQPIFINHNEIDQQKISKKRKSNAHIKSKLAEDSEKLEEAETKPKKMKKKKNKKINLLEAQSAEAPESRKENEEKEKSTKNHVRKDDKSTIEKKNHETAKSEIKVSTGKISKRHKRNQKRISKNAMEKAAADASRQKKPEIAISGGFDAAGNDWTSNVHFGKRSDESKDSASQDQRHSENGGTKDFKNRCNRPNAQDNNGTKRRVAKIRDDKEHKRRKPDTGSIKCIINGLEVEIVKYDGFPVKKEDAERLKELREKMTMKGIPRSEIDAAMKLERRKAEKALTRVKKQVCFHCRKAGHNLSDCPELGDEESATGICFKCGSTEHTHFECKVTKKEEFRFASCFICREQGHIAKQCPDNPKGLYPQGGACKICGDVTHLKKDCPDLTREKEETTVTLGTIAAKTLESLDDDSTNRVTKDESKKPRSKIVKF